ncbi:ABC transporter ATP-binding protein [Mesorhizobium sp. VK22B]|uniref:ABC transporter ATP-binding protein n=1 Tax=Mesorhizobium captivum TaxID=3072319 RepID=A0ABU4YYU7_9HYPH|nr:ABC transporter ATP-binding protein [Mesorhizobium sp. VK22B]MDX8492145.1 ABC transporter ATP-binding protein [Mesorhizobium sp. VK22B]
MAPKPAPDHVTQAEPVLDIRDLVVEFPTRRGVLTAIRGISLTIARGEILGIVGESGAGKSLTGAAVIGLLEPPGRVAGGQILVGQKRIDTLSRRAMAALRGKVIGAIFQDPLTSLNPLLTIGDQLVETIRRHLPLSSAQAARRAVDLLAEVGIPSPELRVQQYPHQFSGGMRQRVVIALALAGKPDLVIADEPTTALDVSIQAQITALVKRICRDRGTAVMLVTHDMGVIAETADRVAVMYAGRIVEVGPVEDIIRRPKHPYTQGLIGSIPSIAGHRDRLSQIDGAMPRLNAMPEGCAFSPRCALADARCRSAQPTLAAIGRGLAACWKAPSAKTVEAA